MINDPRNLCDLRAVQDERAAKLAKRLIAPPNPVLMQIQARWVVWLLQFYVALTAIVAACSTVKVDPWDSSFSLLALFLVYMQNYGAALMLAAGGLSGLCFLFWSVTAQRNVLAFVPRETIDGGTVAFALSWFIPLLNLYMPFVHMCDLWRASDIKSGSVENWHTLPVPREFNLWWICWVTPGVALFLCMSMNGSDAAWFWPVYLAVNIISALFCIRIVRGITERHVHKLHAIEAEARVKMGARIAIPIRTADDTAGVTIDISQKSDLVQ